MYSEQVPLFKELTPFGGKLDEKNRWIQMANLVPWDEVESIYRSYFDLTKQSVLKNGRLILGLMIGQMILEMSDREIVEHFHENPYFQYFCGQSSFVVRLEKRVIHPSLLSKRRKRLGVAYMKQFEAEILGALLKKGIIKGKTLKLDATVFESKISYPTDVKLLNTVREWCCKKILFVKNKLDPSQKIRTVRNTARKVYLRFQKTRRKTKAFVRKTRNQMLRFVRRNIDQLTQLVASAKTACDALSSSALRQLEDRLAIAQQIYTQQHHMAKTRGHRIADRIVSFHQPLVRPIIRGKEKAAVEFGIKTQVALVDGYAFLDRADFSPFHEGNDLPLSIAQHQDRFGRSPDSVIADQLYATRANRLFLKEHAINHAFKPTGRPPNLPDNQARYQRKIRKKQQSSRNAIEGLFGHLKSRFNLQNTTWTTQDGPELQVRFGILAFNLVKASAL